MRNKPAVLIFLLFSILSTRSKAQTYYTSTEVGVAFGGSQYFGDLNENYGFKTVNMAGGLYLRKRFNSYIALKIVANYTQVGYDDKYNSDLYDKQRNLNFKSQIYEGALQAEFNFFAFITGNPDYRFTPFLTGGIGAFGYDPYTTYNGVKYFLRQQGTEGQFAGYADRKYTNISPCFPIGIGAKFWITGGVNLTLEIADRLTTTDYLDDVSNTYVGASAFKANSVAVKLQDRSIEITPTTPLGRAGKQRGNTSSYDQYIVALLSMSWNFTSYRCPSFLSHEDIIRKRN